MHTHISVFVYLYFPSSLSEYQASTQACISKSINMISMVCMIRLISIISIIRVVQMISKAVHRPTNLGRTCPRRRGPSLQTPFPGRRRRRRRGRSESWCYGLCVKGKVVCVWYVYVHGYMGGQAEEWLEGGREEGKGEGGRGEGMEGGRGEGMEGGRV